MSSFDRESLDEVALMHARGRVPLNQKILSAVAYVLLVVESEASRAGEWKTRDFCRAWLDTEGRS